MKLSDFSLLKEDENTYHIGHPKGGKSLQIPKKGMSDKAHALIARLKQKGMKGYAEGEEVTAEPEMTAQAQPVEPAVAESEGVQDSPEAIVADAQAQAPTQSVAQAELSQSPTEPTQATPSPEQPSEQMGMLPNNTKSLEKEKQSVEQGFQAEAKAGKEASQALKNASEAIEQLPSQNDILQKHNAKDQELQQAFANKTIDPNRYLNNMGTGSKLSTGIAMILGGVGGALTGQENPVVKFLNNAIANDIESQRADQSKAQNLWKMNKEATGDDLQANLATQNQLLSIAKVKAQQAVANAQGPEAKARAAQLIAGIDAQINQGNWMRSRLSNQASPGTEQAHVSDMETMRMLNPKLRDEMEKKYIPGVGVAKIPPSAEQRQELVNYQSLGQRLEEAKNFAETKAGAFSAIPGTAAKAQADNLRNSIAAELNKLYGLNRLTDIEYHNFLDQIPNPGSFFHDRAIAKLNDLQGQLEDRQKTVLKGLGVTPFKKAPTDQQAMAWARANPQDPDAALVLKAAGVR